MHGVSIALVVVLVLFATIFQSSLAPGIEVGGESGKDATDGASGIPGAFTPTPAGAGAIALASPTPAASPAAVANVGADTEPILPTYRIVSY